MPAAPRQRSWPRFSVRTVLFWVTPFVAIAAAISRWSGPYKSEFLNDHARWTALLLWTAVWAIIFLSGRARDARD